MSRYFLIYLNWIPDGSTSLYTLLHESNADKLHDYLKDKYPNYAVCCCEPLDKIPLQEYGIFVSLDID